MEYVGRKVRKDFEGHGLFTGTVKSYDDSRGYFRVVYDDGDLEEMDLAEITSVLADDQEPKQEAMGEPGPAEITRKSKGSGSRSIGGKSRKRRRVERKTLTSSGNNNNNNFVEVNEGLENDKLGINEVAVDNASESRLNLDLNEVIGLDLNKEVDFNGKEEVGLRGFIDLNVDVNENDAFEHGTLQKNSSLETVEKKDRGFDLNLGLEDDSKTPGADCEGQLTDCIVEDAQKGVVNCGVETLHSGLISKNVEGKSLVRQLDGGLLDIDVNDANLFDVELTGPSNDGFIAGVEVENEIVGSTGKGRRGRKRKKVADATVAVTETSLRRSSRRARGGTLSVRDHVAISLDAADDSPAVSGVSEEKVTMSAREESEKQDILPPKVELPPSSKYLNLEGMPVLDVFSIYAFLRSFSISLFLSPFELEDFVESVICNDPNFLFNSIHVSLLQALRKHLESFSDDNSASPCDCLRSLNWDLLDLITWPIFMVEYLIKHSHGLQPSFDLRCLRLAGSDYYYKQPTSVKIQVLRCLCDDVMEAEMIRSELNRRTQGTEQNADLDRSMKFNNLKRRRAAGGIAGGSCLTGEEADEATDFNSDECCLCKMDGNLICCDGCPAAFHAKCVGVASSLLPEGDWYCPECQIDKRKPWLKVGKSIRGAEFLGSDPYDRLYYGSCGYLLVLNSSGTESVLKYYHRNDLPAVIETLKLSSTLYSDMVTAIYKHLHISPPIGGLKNDNNFHHPSVISDSLVKGQTHTLDDHPLAPSGTCSDDELVNVPKRNETLRHGVKVESRVTSSECLVEAELDCSTKFSGSLNDTETPENVHNIGNCTSKLTSSEVTPRKNIGSATPACSSPKINSTLMAQRDDKGGYVNYYDFARTASSVIEELTQKSSDKMPGDTIGSVDKIISTQLKAISNNFSEFHWPNIQNRKHDARKEKCGWCYACMFLGDERDCFFVMNDKGLSSESHSKEMLGVRLTKNRRGHFNDLLCQILCIEDRLQGLLSGPWLNPHHSRLWRKRALKASDIATLKNLLLTLESNMRHLALSADWLKLVDTVPTVGSARYVVTSNNRVPSKQGTGRKKARYLEPETDPSSHGKGGLSLFWWRGGRLSRQLFNWKVLPYSLARKAARQAGCTKIPGLLYPENSDCAKRSKCIAWRASVETSSSVEQLALQVRDLDRNIKWDDIANTNILQKMDNGTKKPSRSFKKVIIRRKSMEGTFVKYLLDFGKRRFIPDIVVKHGALVEDSSSERKKYWLEENHVPLHLLKTFEEKRIARRSNKLNSWKHQESRIKKPCKKKGFSYLFEKADKSDNYQCGHCNKDVLIRDAVSCQYCEGFFHRRHVKKSAGSIADECTYACHKCLDGTTRRLETKRKSELCKSKKTTKIVRPLPSKTRKQGGRRKEPLKSQDNKKSQYVVPLRRSARRAKCVALQNGKKRGRPKGKQKKSRKGALKKSKKSSLKRKRRQRCSSYWVNGLQLSRKPEDERVLNFGSKNIIVGSGELVASVDHPKCRLCDEQEISPTLNYIACECGDWFHGDAFDLKAENIGNVIGFKCSKCRNRNPPVCPHRTTMASGNVISVNKNNDLGIDGTDEQCYNQALFNQGSEDQKSQLKGESMDLSLTSINHEKQSLESISNLKPALKISIENGHAISCSGQDTAGCDNLRGDLESTQEFAVSKVNYASHGDDAVESDEGCGNVASGVGTESSCS